MAKFRSGILGKISGSIGATEFVNSRYGQVLRSKTIPIKYNSVSGDFSKTKFKDANYLWGNLTVAQHKAWVELANSLTRIDKAGNEVPCRAIDVFKSVARNLIEINEPVIFDAPKKVYPKTLDNIDVEVIVRTTNNEQRSTTSLEDIKLHFDPAIDKNVKYKIFATPMLRRTMYFVKPCWYRKIAVIDSGFQSGSSIFNEYNSIFKGIDLGTYKFGFLFIPTSTISGFTASPIEILTTNNEQQSTDSQPLSSNNKQPATNYEI